jgi:hypothetical protein
VALASS